MMKRIVATLFFLSLVLGAIALVIPGFIDWSKHKEGILSQLEPYIDRKIEVGGAVKFRLLPSPQVMLQNVTIANPKGAKSEHLVRLRQLEARMKLGPLLEGRFEVETINFAEPQLYLENLPDGTNNWTGVFRQQEGGITRKADAIKLNSISMTGGTLHYLNQNTGLEWKAEALNLSITANTLFGPYSAAGDMVFNGHSVGVEIKTEKYAPGTPVPLNISFTPKRELPQVKLNGVADLSTGFDLQTEIEISEGSLANLFDEKFLGDIEFLKENTELTGMLNLKGGEATIENISGKFGEKGELSGTLSASFSPGAKPEVTAELTGKNLKVSTKPVFLDVPQGFRAHMKLTGYGIHWQGSYLPTVSLNADSSANEWTIRGLRLENLPGKGLVKLSGVVTPKNRYSAFSIHATADDASKMLSAALLPENNILKALEKSGLLKAVDISGSLDLKPDKISLFGIEGKLGGETAVSGVLNIARDKASFDAHLNFGKADLAKPLSDEYADLMAQVMKSDALLNITVKDFSKGDVAGADFVFKGKVAGGALQIEKLAGRLGPSGSFDVTGKLASVNPLGGMDLQYTLNAGQLGYLSALGLELPPPLWGSNTATLTGKVTGDAQKYDFTVTGKAEAAEVSLTGTATKGNESAYSYQTDVSMKNATWAQIGLPIDKLVAKGAAFDLSAKLSGLRGHYTLSDIKAGGVTGSLSRRDDGYSGTLEADATDFDAWVRNDWKLDDKIDIAFKAKKLLWRETEISNAEFQLEGAPSELKVSRLRGDLWGGSVTAEISSKKLEKGWNGKMKGAIAGAGLQQFAELMDMKGISVGKGDVSFDMTDDDAKMATDWFHGMEGKVEFKLDKLTVERFSPGAVAGLLTNLRGSAPDNAGLQVTRALQSQAATFENVSAAFSLGKGQAVFEGIKLSNADAEVTLRGDYTLGPEKYSVKADVKLKDPAGVPALAVNSSGETEKPATVYTVDAADIVQWLRRQAAPPEPSQPVLELPPSMQLPQETRPEQDPPATSAPVSQEPLEAPHTVIIGGEEPEQTQDPAEESGGDILDVIKRLDDLPEEEQPPVPLQQLSEPEEEIFPEEHEGGY